MSRDFAQQVFCDIFVVERIYTGLKEANNKYKCICMLCGNIMTATHSSLQNGSVKSCFSCRKKKLYPIQEYEIAQKLKNSVQIKHIISEYKIDRSIVYRIQKEFKIKNKKVQKVDSDFINKYKVLSRLVESKILINKPGMNMCIVGKVTKVEACHNDGDDFMVTAKDEQGKSIHVNLKDTALLDDRESRFIEKKCSMEGMANALKYCDELFSCNDIKIAIQKKWIYFSTGAINTYLTFRKEDEARAAFDELKEKFREVVVKSRKRF